MPLDSITTRMFSTLRRRLHCVTVEDGNGMLFFVVIDFTQQQAQIVNHRFETAYF